MTDRSRARSRTFLKYEDRVDSVDVVFGDIVFFSNLFHRCVFPGTLGVGVPTIIAPLGAPDVVINGGFDTDTDWTKGTGWTIAAGVAHHTPGAAANLMQAGVLTIGKSYLTAFTISSFVAGIFRVYAGTGSAGTSRIANGTYSEVLTAAGDTAIYVQATNAASEGDVDDVSYVEVTKDGTAAFETLGL